MQTENNEKKLIKFAEALLTRSHNYVFISVIVLVYFVTENHGKSIKIQIDCDDIMKILAELTNQDYKIPDLHIEVPKSQLDKNGKPIKNPYHPEDSTDVYLLTSPINMDRSIIPNQWQVKQDIEMDLMKAELEQKLDRENHNFIAKPSVISEDELEIVDTSNQTTKADNKIDVVTEHYLKKLKNSGLQVDKKKNILRERKKEIEAVAIENNAVHVEKNSNKKDSNTNQKRFQLKKGVESNKNDQIRIDYTPVKTRMELSDEERAKRDPDNQDFKDFQRRFILVDGHD